MKIDREYINKLEKESNEIRDILVEITSKNGGHLAQIGRASCRERVLRLV